MILLVTPLSLPLAAPDLLLPLKVTLYTRGSWSGAFGSLHFLSVVDMDHDAENIVQHCL